MGTVAGLFADRNQNAFSMWMERNKRVDELRAGFQAEGDNDITAECRALYVEGKRHIVETDDEADDD